MMTIYKDGANKTDLSFSLKQTQINTKNSENEPKQSLFLNQG